MAKKKAAKKSAKKKAVRLRKKKAGKDHATSTASKVRQSAQHHRASDEAAQVRTDHAKEREMAVRHPLI